VSNGELHCVAAGHRMAEAIPLVGRLTGLSVPAAEIDADITVMTGSHSIPWYRRQPTAPTNYELHIPAEHVTAYLAVLDPLITDPARRWPDLGVDDGAGGRWLSVHGTEPEALAALAPLPSVPVEIAMHSPSFASFDWTLVPTERDHPVRASVEWRVSWPAVAALGLHPHTKHAAVCLFSNSVGTWDLDLGEPGYRLYVSTETGGARRAAHLAAAAGLTVLDGPHPHQPA
jgi:hypothetical protein